MYGQKDLFSVLKCLSIVEPEIGYVQGMGYMVAILLMYVDKTDAFSIMLKVVNNKPYSMKEFYKQSMPGLKNAYYKYLTLMKKYLPKLHQHLLDEMVTPNLYTIPWFMTIFATNMPLELTLRIWDIFFIEGQKILFRIALAIMKINEKELLKADFEKVFDILKEYLQSSSQLQFPGKKPINDEENSIVIEEINNKLGANDTRKQSLEQKIDRILEVANNFKFKNKLLDDLDTEYLNNPKEEIMQHCY